MTAATETAPHPPATEFPALAVVIPARNEEHRLARCLRAVAAADARLRAAHPSAPLTRVVVVLDRCTDRSHAVVADWPAVEVLTCQFGNVGAARAAGVNHLIGDPTAPLQPGVPHWIACTDADSAVPTDWLRNHISHARADTDLLLGLVRPDPAEISPNMRSRWLDGYRAADGHPHVHGANMGIRTRAYRRAGGFPSLPEHEDVILTERIRMLGGRVISTYLSPVLTSARTHGRTPGGMAAHLAALADQLHITE